MGIKNKISLILMSVMAGILICSYIIIYILFKNVMLTEVINYQESIIHLNQNLITSFMHSIEQTSLRLTSDPYMGKYLSAKPLDQLSKVQTKSAIISQFTHYGADQVPSNINYFYKNTLFLNDDLPITSAFESKTLDSNSYTTSYNVFSNQEIKNSEWYLNTINAPASYYIFINESTNEFCLAKKIQNNAYIGPYLPKGLGVMVTSIKLDKLGEFFNFVPITPNTSYVLFNSNQDILYQGNTTLPLEIFSKLFSSIKNTPHVDQKSAFLTLNKQDYLANKTSLNWGLSILFLTPYSDISSHVFSAMQDFIIFAFVILLLTPLLAYFISTKMSHPIIKLSDTIGQVKDIRYFNYESLNFGKDKEMIALCNSFKQLITYSNHLIEDIQIQTQKQKQAELQALQAQINPHFIFNAMDVVNWIALSRDQDDIASIMASISNLMRYSITNPNGMVTLSQELENIQEFISIYKLRHEEPINLHIHTILVLDHIYIPKFILQPLIENALKHGLDYTTPIPSLEIDISIYQDSPYLYIEVVHTGKSCSPDLLNQFLAYLPTTLQPSSGFGIRNINERINMHFGGQSGLSYALSYSNHLMATLCIDYSQSTTHTKSL
ncbi:MAG: sensor histidine kinase [Cellulosilyticaceae bacterium]